MKKRRFWDVGDKIDSRPPNLGKSSTAKVMQALIKLDGCLYSSCFDGTDDVPDHRRDGVYRIELPVGAKEEFEEMTGYRLTCIAEVRG